MADPREYLAYDPETGLFTWKKDPPSGRKMKGSVAGFYDPKGYLRVKVRGKSYSLHRLAFLFMGEEVPPEVDHKDRVRDNNRWCNLRPATPSQNAANKRHKVGATGVTGVSRLPNGKYQVRVSCRGRRHYLGVWDELELAELIAQEARHKYHKDFMYDE